MGGYAWPLDPRSIGDVVRRLDLLRATSRGGRRSVPSPISPASQSDASDLSAMQCENIANRDMVPAMWPSDRAPWSAATITQRENRRA